MKRRELLKLGAVAAATAVIAPTEPAAADVVGSLPPELQGLQAVAEAVLPDSLGPDGRREAVAGFVGWLRDHEAGRYLEHGYGHTRLEKTGPAPSSQYGAQLQALEAAARHLHGKAFASVDLEARRALIGGAFERLKVEALGGRPSGRHVAADLMTHFFSSAEANDLCYEAAILRDSCRSLEDSGERPEPLGEKR